MCRKESTQSQMKLCQNCEWVRKAIKSDIFTQVHQYWRENRCKSFQQTVSLSYCDQHWVEFMKIYCCDCKLALCTKCFIKSHIDRWQVILIMYQQELRNVEICWKVSRSLLSKWQKLELKSERKLSSCSGWLTITMRNWWMSCHQWSRREWKRWRV